MRIGIIGAGFIGRAVASIALAAGHEVVISNSRGPQTLSSLVSALPGCRAGTVEEAIHFGEVVLAAIPFTHYRALPTDLLAGKILIDANNYYPERDGHIAPLDNNETTTSEMIAAHVPGAKLVKAFNAILAKDLETDGRPHGAAQRRALPIAGDDKAAKAVVAGLLDDLGFDTVDGGTLKQSWRFERAKPAYCLPLNKADLKAALAAAERDVELPHGSWRH